MSESSIYTNIITIIGIAFFLFNYRQRIFLKGFPIILQENDDQCGPVCLQMIAQYHGKILDINDLEIASRMNVIFKGTSLKGIGEAADSIGLKNLPVSIPFKVLFKEVSLPAIVHWQQHYFVVVYHVTRSKIYVANPNLGKQMYSHEEFYRNWLPSDEYPNGKGAALLLETTDKFYKQQ